MRIPLSLHGLVAFAFAMLVTAVAMSQEYYSSWADKNCCWTQGCCFKIEPTDVVGLGNDVWRIVATGQVVKRKGYSPDGEYHRCACDPHPRGGWKPADANANTRCLFVPHQGS